ncbi:MAG: hypothetical protein SOX68_10175 [Faecalicoccus sp.]|uniref:hypothetical protein n=1 Tax=Faecalicoccus sp. TaxID=1971758 RepID=UPI002A83AFF0|nr:hypothetical protein [Faecalicoccus sp.]MDY4279312.1 hypothetical protein [Faecalicoccus sp.]
MNIITKSLHVIDYEQNNVNEREIPQTFDEYVRDLITYVNQNTGVRDFKSQSAQTEVLGCVKEIFRSYSETDVVQKYSTIIAERLLNKEVEAQKKVARLNTNVQKGSLIQALLSDGDDYFYLLAKVEHSDFVDDVDFSFKSGFSKDKKKIWKSCLLDISDISNADAISAKIYSNTVAQYWSHDFLELVEMVSDETNTLSAFKAIEKTLNRVVRKEAPRDYTLIRNSAISYLRNKTHIDYEDLIDSIIGEDYKPADYPEEKIPQLRDKLKSLPEKAHFDRQFNSTPSVLSARIKKTYEVNEGIQLKVNGDIPDIKETIQAYRDIDGIRYIKIKTDNEVTFRSFAKE